MIGRMAGKAEVAVGIAAESTGVAEPSRVGVLLREWRRHRRISQLELASRTDSSARHLSCVEPGRAKASRNMVLRLADHLDVPLRERNDLLLAAGYAPEYREGGLDGDEMTAVRSALEQLLAGHEPYPAVVVDREWNLVSSNRAVSVLLDGVASELMEAPVNVMRLALHPGGLAARLTNFVEMRAHLLERLLRQVSATGDARLRALYDEVRAYGPPEGVDDLPAQGRIPVEVVIPMRFRSPDGELSMFSTVATFGAPADITLSELAIESFFPADEHTAAVLRERAGEA